MTVEQIFLSALAGGVISALLAGLFQIINARGQRRADAPSKATAAASQLSDSAMKIVNELQEELKRYQEDRQAEREELLGRIRHLEERVLLLEIEKAELTAEINQLRNEKADKRRRDELGRFIPEEGN
jgi:chromosome segregation ATPase